MFFLSLNNKVLKRDQSHYITLPGQKVILCFLQIPTLCTNVNIGIIQTKYNNVDLFQVTTDESCT